MSLVLFFIMDAVVFFISGAITKWITKPAEEAFRKQKEFIADASHELKTPLSVIMASADELGAGGASDESGRRYIENIRYESDRMRKLLASLLELSRLEDADVRKSYREENLSRIIEKTCLALDKGSL